MLNLKAPQSTQERLEAPMAEPAVRQATYEDLLQVPEHLVAEILNGELHAHPRSAPKHTFSASALGGKLFDPFGTGRGGPGGWWILDEPELHLGAKIMVPDLKNELLKTN